MIADLARTLDNGESEDTAVNRQQRRAAKGQNRSSADPGTASAHQLVEAGFAHHQAGRLAEAEALYDQALAANPRHADGLFLRGSLYFQTGRQQRAAADLRASLDIQPDNAFALNNLGNVCAALGLTDEAAAHYASAIGLRPDYPEALNNLGIILQGQGKLDDAISRYAKAVSLKPDYVDAFYNLGSAHQAKDMLEEAIACYRQALRIRSAYAEALNNLGMALKSQGKVADAIASYAQAIRIKPNYAQAFNNLGNAFKEQGQLDHAIAQYTQALGIMPDYPDALNNLATALQAQGKLDEAMSLYDRALAVKPDDPDALFNLGTALQEQGKLEDALARYAAALRLRPGYPQALNNFGNTLILLGRADDALNAFRAAIASHPHLPDPHYNLGNALTETGDLEGAFRAYETAATLAPRRGSFHRMLADTGHVKPDDAKAQRMEDLIADADQLPEADRLELHFALGTVYANGGQHERSFGHLLIANRLKRKHIAYDEDGALALFDRIKAAFTQDRLARKRQLSASDRQPIFVVGMPRSGTTLVEQILASHPQVHGAGEVPDFPRLVDRLMPTGFPEASPDDGLLMRLARDYQDSLWRHAPQAARIVDKLPDNFLRIGLIHMALPGARIVHIRRDPVDTCLSCFSKLFRGPLPYAYDLAELGRYYRAYDGLMRHWHAMLPPESLLDIRYEDIVADIETHARRLIAFCDLPWDQACLAFHQTKRVVQTASATQVRQPLYGSSVGRWHGFGDRVQPLLDGLGPLS